ncbi:MAG: site-specific integrase [Acidimicrobiales bacterium]
MAELLRRYPTPRTREQYRQRLQDLLRSRGRSSPAAVTEGDLVEWVTAVTANNSVRVRISTARTFFRWCLRMRGDLVGSDRRVGRADDAVPHDLRQGAEPPPRSLVELRGGLWPPGRGLSGRQLGLHAARASDGGHLFDLLDIQQMLDQADPATTQRSYIAIG